MWRSIWCQYCGRRVGVSVAVAVVAGSPRTTVLAWLRVRTASPTPAPVLQDVSRIRPPATLNPPNTDHTVVMCECVIPFNEHFGAVIIANPQLCRQQTGSPSAWTPAPRRAAGGMRLVALPISARPHAKAAEHAVVSGASFDVLISHMDAVVAETLPGGGGSAAAADPELTSSSLEFYKGLLRQARWRKSDSVIKIVEHLNAQPALQADETIAHLAARTSSGA